MHHLHDPPYRQQHFGRLSRYVKTISGEDFSDRVSQATMTSFAAGDSDNDSDMCLALPCRHTGRGAYRESQKEFWSRVVSVVFTLY